VTETLDKNYDALVVGSGAAGSIAVKELTERGLDVLLLEAGRDISEADFKPPPETQPRPLSTGIGIGLGSRLRAALKGQHVQARRAFFMPVANPFLVNDRENPYSTARDSYFLWIRGRVLGGRLHTYGRVLLRMSDYDFKGASRDGIGLDWPISYADLAPYYDQVEEFLGLYGQRDGLAQLPDGVYVGPSKLTKAEQQFKARIESHWPERRVVSWRYAAPNPGRVPLGIAAARKTGRLTTRTDAVVRQITVENKTGKADGAIFVDRLTKEEHRVSANVVVLCASTIESIRLLHNSACDRHPSGLGNSSGLLGRFFMDQAPSLTFGSIPGVHGFERDESAPVDPVYPPAGGVFIPRFHNLDGQPRAGFARGMSFQAAMGRFPVPEERTAAFAMMGYGEMLPSYDNRVTLHPSKTDAWGIRIPHIRCAVGENERALMREQVRIVKEMAAACGYDLNFTGSPLGLDARKVFPEADPISRIAFRLGFRRTVAMGAAIHECGGARLGTDPATSVLNEYNQSWDVPNLFVTDASCFPSSGLVGPTLTIMALTARTCDYIARQYTEGRWDSETTPLRTHPNHGSRP
jgi:choline dehydrogenase-like flavoprotein